MITAVLLFNQFAILRSRALLAISIGYLFAGLLVIPWMPAFPGVFAPSGLLGAGLQSAGWFQILRLGGFPAFVIAYAIFKDADPPKRSSEGSVSATILFSVAITTAVVCAVTFLVTAGDAHLHRISIDSIHFSPLAFFYCRLSNRVERPCARRPLDAPALDTRSVADGGCLRVCNRVLSGSIFRSSPVQRRLVFGPGLRARVQQRAKRRLMEAKAFGEFGDQKRLGIRMKVPSASPTHAKIVHRLSTIVIERIYF